MGRQKTYDRAAAVEAAMTTFWRGGYSNVGVRQIEQDTAINRFALQTDFGGKRGLFLEALEAYLAVSHETVLKPLHRGDLDGVIAFFEAIPKQGSSDPRRCGCLMVNTAIENAELGMDDVQALTEAHYAEMERLFTTALAAAQTAGTIDVALNISDAARALLTFAMGLEVFIRMTSDTGAVSRQVEFIVSQIKGWRVSPAALPS